MSPPGVRQTQRKRPQAGWAGLCAFVRSSLVGFKEPSRTVALRHLTPMGPIS